jgi:hypothetical protein
MRWVEEGIVVSTGMGGPGGAIAGRVSGREQDKTRRRKNAVSPFYFERTQPTFL